MKLHYAFSFLAVLGLTQVTMAQPPCLTNFTTPVGQVNRTTGWTAVSVPATTSVTLNMTTTSGSTTATVTGCNAVLAGAPVSGPNIPGGTTVVSTACTSVTLSQAATVTGAALHTFTLPAYTGSAPPTNTGIPGGLNCSVCPAVFTINACAGDYFTYQMCVGNIYTISMCGAATNWDSYLAITTTAGTVLATGSPTSDDDGCGTVGGHATLSYVCTATGTYRVRLWSDPCTVNAGLCGTLQVACNPVPTPPSNDDAINATSLGSPVGTACSFTAGTNSFATQSAGTPSGCLTGGCGTASGAFAGYDVWYSAGVPASGNLSVVLNGVSATSTAMAVYTGTPPGALTQVTNSCVCNGFVSLSGLAGGSTVYIRVWTGSGVPTMGSFQICAYEPIPPPNDNPCGAFSLPVNTTCGLTSFTTESATALSANITAPAPSCGTPIAGGDVWFRAVMPATGSMTLNTQAGSLTDMAMTVYTVASGSIATPCPTAVTATLTEVACNDNFGASTMPSVTVSGTPGVTYYIRMWNKTTAFGTASICAVQNVPPPNDNPCGAIALPVNTGCVFPAAYSTQFATITSGVPAASCNAGPYTSDVWFSAVIPPSGQLQLDMDDASLTDAGMAVYTGACGGPLTQIPAGQGGCSVGGSGNGPLMPITNITGVAPGTTVYIRIWRQTGNDGNFLICARNPVNPAGCYYTLRMADAAGDGWGGGFVTVDIGGVQTNYTVTGALAYITFAATLGQTVIISYTPVGGFQNQVSFLLQASNGFTLFNSANPPAAGANYAFTVNATCNVPPAPVSDCIGNVTVCTSQTFSFAPTNTGNVVDLNATNDGCLAGEQQGVWFQFTTNAAGNIAFTIQVATGTDYDFAIWGPSSGAPTCPPSGAPLRCSWSGATGNTGLNYSSIDFTEGAGGDKWVQYISAAANQTYLLYVDNWSRNGISFNMAWDNQPTNLIDCILPVEFLEFEAIPKPRQVDLKWTTASEHNTAYFNVERSDDGMRFLPIGTVSAMGSSQVLTEYTFTDDAPLKGVNYYRLDQVDGSGQRDYSKVVTAVYRYANVPLTVYPNPAGESLWASFELPEEGTVRWRILDASGRMVREGRSLANAGVSQMEVPLDIDAGSYLLELSDGSGVPLGNARFVRR